MDVRSVMTATPAFCTADTPLRDVARMMADNDCGLIPVLDATNTPVGVVTDRDIAVRIVAQGRDAKSSRAADCMTSPVITIGEDSTLSECCDVMETQKVRRVPVVDASGGLCGIVSLADVALASRDQTIAEVVKQVSEPTQH